MNETTPPAVPLSVGELLRQCRLEQALTLEEVVADTRISLVNLHAIESMNYEKLPADAFAKGLVALYANFLGQDGRLLADQFFSARDNGERTRLTVLQQHRVQTSLQPGKLAEPTHFSSAAIAGLILTVIVVSFAGFSFYFSWNPLSYFAASRSTVASSPAGSAFHPADPATNTGTPRASLSLQAVFSKDNRVIIALDDQPPREQFYAKGSTMQWEAAHAMQLEFFQPDSVELQFNGAPLPFPPLAEGRYLLRLPVAKTAP
jgi:cytoskeletal protein RodZ